MAVSLGFSASPILINKLIDDYGWQMSWQIIAICLVIFSVFILQFYRNKPEDFGMKPDGVVIHKEQKARKNVRAFTLIEAKKTRAFWIISLILAFNSFFFTGFTFHVVSIFESVGFSKNQAISIFLPISIIAISTSTCGNIFSDNIKHKIYIFIMILAGFMASLGLIFLKESLGLYLLIIGLGVLGGLFTVVNAVTWPRYYGRLYLGAITGKVMSVLVIASAVAPTLFSYCFTVFESYSYVSYITVVILLFVTIASLKVKNPQK
ncbi:MFS transporter [Algibacter mikhailovii]|nr:MFS transporter [Algibacter mikhailovii]